MGLRNAEKPPIKTGHHPVWGGRGRLGTDKQGQVGTDWISSTQRHLCLAQNIFSPETITSAKPALAQTCLAFQRQENHCADHSYHLPPALSRKSASLRNLPTQVVTNSVQRTLAGTCRRPEGGRADLKSPVPALRELTTRGQRPRRGQRWH